MSLHESIQDELFSELYTHLAPTEQDWVDVDDAFEQWKQIQQACTSMSNHSLPQTLDSTLYSVASSTTHAILESSESLQRQHEKTKAQVCLQLLERFWNPRILGLLSVACLAFLIWGESELFQKQQTQSSPHPQKARSLHALHPVLQRIPKGLSIRLWYTGAGLKFRAKSEVRDGDTLEPGDLIQLSYHTAEPTYLVIASINHRGDVSILAPLEGKKSLLLKKGKGTLETLELDEYIGVEKLVALTSTSPFSIERVRRSIRSAFYRSQRRVQNIHLIPGSWTQSWTLLIRKNMRKKGRK